MWFNPIMKWLVGSPLHFFVSKNTMLITYTGRKSGKTFTTPVNYLRDGNTLYTTSMRERNWWRNLRDGNPVQLMIQRKEISAIPQVIEDNEAVKNHFSTYLQLAPHLARYYKVELDNNGIPQQGDLARIVDKMVFIEFRVAD